MKGKLAALMPLAGGVAALRAHGALRKPKPLSVHYLDAPTKVLVVGGGFGGVTAVKALVHALGGSREVGVALLDRVNFTTFYPMVPKVVSSNVEIGHLAHSIRSIVTPLGVDFNQTEVEGVDFEAREVLSNKGRFPYDYLVLAPGSRTAFFNAKGVQENAIDLKGLREALQVRNTIIDRLEEAHWARGDHDEGLLTFVFVGGGPTGVEGAAGAHDLIHNVLKPDYPDVDFDRVRLVLINSGSRILKDIDPSLANAAIHRLASQRIEVLNDTKVTEIRPDAVVLSDGRTIAAHTTVWAAGVEPGPLVQDLDVPKDARGHLLVDEYLRVKDRLGVYAVGDCISIEGGERLPALAQSAEQEGEVAGRNLAAEIRGNALTPFRYRSLGQLVDLGSTSALTDILGVKVSGIMGEAIWRIVYLKELGYNLNRAQVLADWAIDRLTRPSASKLYEDPPTP
ncbi:MAG: NAD(P)/FAD-dependent oxidoreductase [Actinomycetota bacterium]|nr:NAD(P)/FAD-dependent oxidoreductase [Actinomycetota bacterium]